MRGARGGGRGAWLPHCKLFKYAVIRQLIYSPTNLIILIEGVLSDMNNFGTGTLLCFTREGTSTDYEVFVLTLTIIYYKGNRHEDKAAIDNGRTNVLK